MGRGLSLGIRRVSWELSPHRKPLRKRKLNGLKKDICRVSDIICQQGTHENPIREIRARLHGIQQLWPVSPNALGMLTGDLNICDLEEAGCFGATQTLTYGDRGRTNASRAAFQHTLGLAQPDFTQKDVAHGHIRNLSRIDRAFINIPLSEPMDIRYLASVVGNLRDSTLLSDLITMRLYIEQLVRKTSCTGLSPLGLVGIHLQFEIGGLTRCPTGGTLILFALWSNSMSFFPRHEILPARKFIGGRRLRQVFYCWRQALPSGHTETDSLDLRCDAVRHGHLSAGVSIPCLSDVPI